MFATIQIPTCFLPDDPFLVRLIGSVLEGRPTAPPVNLVLPSIEAVGMMPGGYLHALRGQWKDAKEFAYQWLRDGSPIAGATGQTYTLLVADDGYDIHVEVTATNALGSTSEESNAITIDYLSWHDESSNAWNDENELSYLQP